MLRSFKLEALFKIKEPFYFNRSHLRLSMIKVNDFWVRESFLRLHKINNIL